MSISFVNSRFVLFFVDLFHNFCLLGDFYFLQIVETDSGAHPASCAVGTGVLSWGINRLRCDVEQSSPSSAEVKNEWRYTSTPSIYLHGADDLTF